MDMLVIIIQFLEEFYCDGFSGLQSVPQQVECVPRLHASMPGNLAVTKAPRCQLRKEETQNDGKIFPA